MFVVCLFFLLMGKNTYALSNCYQTIEIANGALSVFKQLCDTSFGGGASFYGSVAYKVKCEESSGLFADNAFQVTYTCNTCTSADIKKEVSEFTESGQKKCRTTDYQCSYTNGEWGHSFPLPKICGKTDSTLSGCGTEESSSSVSEGSSDFQAQVRPSGLRCDPFGSDRSSCADRASLSGFLMYRKLWQDLRLWLRTEGRKFSSYEMSSAFFRVSERMDEELSRLKKRKQARSYNENGNSLVRAFGTRPFGGRCLYGHGYSQGDGFGSEGGSR